MTYNYEENKPQQPQPNYGYVITVPNNQPAPQPQEQYQLSQAQVHDIHSVKMRQAHANARLTEADLMLNGMREIRSALTLTSLTVAPGDTGSKDRPPLEPAFNDRNRERLQGCYLRMAERVVNHFEFFLERELKIELTNEIKRDVNFKGDEDGL